MVQVPIFLLFHFLYAFIMDAPDKRKELSPRALRREKQRAANLGRAEKMHIVRRELDEQTFFKAAASKTIPKINIGCSGWFYWDWKNVFYPADLPTNQWFPYYADRFKTVELNAPFYSWPTIGTIKTWKRQAGRRKFIYTVKVCELITHIKKFQGTRELVKDFSIIADLLGPSMGCFLFQLPPSFQYTQARLKTILGQLDHTRRNVVEFRHASWWNEKVFTEFRKTGTIFCSCSGPKLPNDVVKTADDIYVRFHGTAKWYRHDYSKSEISDWAERIKASKAKRIWAYFNNDHDGYAIKNARELVRQLKSA